MDEKHRVLILSDRDLKEEFHDTVLWRSDVMRHRLADMGRALDCIQMYKPRLIVVDWPDEAALVLLVGAIRRQDETKKTGIAVVSRTLSGDAEKELIGAGANLILPMPLNPELWNSRLDQLLNVTPRLSTRIGVRFALWSTNLAGDRQEFPGTALNLSQSGMLIKTRRELESGTKLDIRFTLPGQHCQLKVLGQVMWGMQAGATVFRSGVQFIVMRQDARERIGAFISRRREASTPVAPVAAAAGEAAEWERELRISEARKLSLMNAANEAIVSVDSEGHILEFNTAAEAVFGVRRAAVLGKLLADTLVPASQRETLRDRFRQCFTGRGDLFETRRFTAAGRRGDGAEFPAEVSMIPMVVRGRLLFWLFFRDVSTLRQAAQMQQQLEEQLRQAQKLEAVGTLAGGIAHDFNNILASILGYAELSLEAAPRGDAGRGYLEKIVASALRGRDLVRQILDFSRKSMHRREPVLLSPIIKETVKLLRAALPANIFIRQRIQDETCMASLSPTHIYQVLMNLCTNAAHAMHKEGGVIEIWLDAINLDGQQMQGAAGLSRGAYVRLSVRDTGCGMAADLLPHIFEPFFTTKKKGQGSGIGLAVVHGIVKNAGGDIFVESRPGRGSAFHLLLPRVKSAAKAPARNKPAAGGSGRILLVDDEKALVDAWRRQLQALGYTVAARRSSRAALRAFEKEPDAFDLVITDLTMPHMAGDVLVRRMLALRPDMPVIVSTGYSKKIAGTRLKGLGVKAVVTKPAPLHDLARAISRALAARAPASSRARKNNRHRG